MRDLFVLMRSVIIKAVVTTLEILSECDTPYGYMMVCECKKCFTKYRFHGTIDGKFDFENFADNFLMRVEMEKEEL